MPKAYCDHLQDGNDAGHPSQAVWGCVTDHYLREYRFKIAARPNKGPTIWERDGERYTHDEAIALVKSEMKADGQKLERKIRR